MDSEVVTRLDRIESLLAAILERETIKDYYSTDEFARLVGKADFTVREWARLDRIRAEKRKSGRGALRPGLSATRSSCAINVRGYSPSASKGGNGCGRSHAESG